MGQENDASGTDVTPTPKRRRTGKTRKLQCSTSPSKIRKKLLSKDIFQMRLEGHTIREIAETLQKRGFKTSLPECARILKTELEGLGASQETKEQARSLALERLDVWTKGLFKRTAKGNEKAIGTALKIEERRARMLGSDAPLEQSVKLTVLGQLNWVFDMIEKEFGPDGTKRILRRISEQGGPPAIGAARDDGAG